MLLANELTGDLGDAILAMLQPFMYQFISVLVSISPQRSATPVGARRSSITSDFLAEENQREKELERLLDRRIADLKTNTDYIIQKYT